MSYTVTSVSARSGHVVNVLVYLVLVPPLVVAWVLYRTVPGSTQPLVVGTGTFA